MTQQYSPEMGQAVFGNSWCEYRTPMFVDALLDYILKDIERVFWNINQREWDRYEDPRIPGIVFNPYYWGGCECGYEEAEAEWDANNRHNLDCYQIEYGELRGKYGSSLNIPAAEEGALCSKHGIPYNDGAGSAVHCTCDYKQRWEEFCKHNDHQPDCPVIQPNFKFGGVEIRWYKHPGRGQTCNVDWDEKQWRLWLDSCMESIRSCKDEIQVL